MCRRRLGLTYLLSFWRPFELRLSSLFCFYILCIELFYLETERPAAWAAALPRLLCLTKSSIFRFWDWLITDQKLFEALFTGKQPFWLDWFLKTGVNAEDWVRELMRYGLSCEATARPAWFMFSCPLTESYWTYFWDVALHGSERFCKSLAAGASLLKAAISDL